MTSQCKLGITQPQTRLKGNLLNSFKVNIFVKHEPEEDQQFLFIYLFIYLFIAILE